MMNILMQRRLVQLNFMSFLLISYSEMIHIAEGKKVKIFLYVGYLRGLKRIEPEMDPTQHCRDVCYVIHSLFSSHLGRYT